MSEILDALCSVESVKANCVLFGVCAFGWMLCLWMVDYGQMKHVRLYMQAAGWFFIGSMASALLALVALLNLASGGGQ